MPLGGYLAKEEAPLPPGTSLAKLWSRIRSRMQEGSKVHPQHRRSADAAQERRMSGAGAVQARCGCGAEAA